MRHGRDRCFEGLGLGSQDVTGLRLEGYQGLERVDPHLCNNAGLVTRLVVSWFGFVRRFGLLERVQKHEYGSGLGGELGSGRALRSERVALAPCSIDLLGPAIGPCII